MTHRDMTLSDMRHHDMTQHDTTARFTGADDGRPLPSGHPVTTAVGRTLSDIFSFWSLCNVTKCRRAGRCVSDPHRCLDSLLPLISDAVHDEGQRELAAKTEGLSFEEMLERWPEGLPNLWRWTLALDNRVGAPSPRVLPEDDDDHA